MTAVCTTYILVAAEGFGLPYLPGCMAGVLMAAFLLGAFVRWYVRMKKVGPQAG